MYTVETPKIEIRLISEVGKINIYDDYDTFISSITYYFVDKYVVDSFKKQLLSDTCTTRYIVRDKFGGVFTKNEVLRDVYKLKYKKRGVINCNYKFRYDPVPHTGHRKWSFKNFYKTPHTVQEKRWNTAHIEYVRGSRHPSRLPNPWDDCPRSDAFIKRSWKKTKKRRQWM
jgi:hypothetical protein